MTKLDFIEKYFFFEKAKFMMPAFQRQSKRFGNKWKEDFLYVLDNFFENNNHLEDAINAYNHFCFDGMRLQKRFEKTQNMKKIHMRNQKKMST